MKLEEIVSYCQQIYLDVDLAYVKEWKEKRPRSKAIGFLPIYVPREIIYAARMLPVGVMGGGDMLEIIKGDAFFQSYICHIPRSVVELGLSRKLDILDGMLFPAICDVVRNLSGMWQILFPDKYVRYFDFPQNFDPEIGGQFYIGEMSLLKEDLERLGNVKVTEEALKKSISFFNENRRLITALYDSRSERPWQVPTHEAYLLIRAGNVLDVEEHNGLLRDYLSAVKREERRRMDNIRVVLIGSFCEQPPLGLIKTLENAGCYIVDDDFILGARWLLEDVSLEGNSIEALSDAFLRHSTYSSSKYEAGMPKGDLLVEIVRRRKADGVIFCAPSFCDPALLDRPDLQKALDDVGIAHTSCQYAENTGQFQTIREQTGTFSDSIKLWSDSTFTP